MLQDSGNSEVVCVNHAWIGDSLQLPLSWYDHGKDIKAFIYLTSSMMWMPPYCGAKPMSCMIM